MAEPAGRPRRPRTARVTLALGVVAAIAVAAGVAAAVVTRSDADAKRVAATASIEDGGLRVTLTSDRSDAKVGDTVHLDLTVENTTDATRSFVTDCMGEPVWFDWTDRGRSWSGPAGEYKALLLDGFPTQWYEHAGGPYLVQKVPADGEHAGCIPEAEYLSVGPHATVDHQLTWMIRPDPLPDQAEIAVQVVAYVDAHDSSSNGRPKLGSVADPQDPIGASKVVLPMTIHDPAAPTGRMRAPLALDAALADPKVSTWVAAHPPGPDAARSGSVVLWQGSWYLAFSTGSTSASGDPERLQVSVATGDGAVALE